MATGAFLVLTAASLALQSLSTVQASKAAKGKADQLKAVGEEAEKRQRIEGRRLRGEQRTKFAKSGVDVSALGDTPLGVLAQSAEDAELNALRARFGFDARSSDVRNAGDQRTLQGIAGIADTAIQAGFRFDDIRQRQSGGTSGKTLIGQNQSGRDFFPDINPLNLQPSRR